MTKTVAIYARVSTDKQDATNQLLELRSLCERLGYRIYSEFVDQGISGAKGRNDRPALDAVLKAATQRKFDMVMCWSLDRLGRSLQHLIEILNEVQSLKVDLYFHQQSMDTSTPSGRLFFSIAASFAEYEKNLIRERVIAGQQRAKSQGKKLGRPSKMSDGMRNAVKLLRDKGMGIKEISRTLNLGIGTVYSAISA
jgi:DNA invertase Pin-like site-specific DNA recombinase